MTIAFRWFISECVFEVSFSKRHFFNLCSPQQSKPVEFVIKQAVPA